VTDTIEIRGLRVLATHGLLEEEIARAQPFEIDLDLETELADAETSDDLQKTVDYGPIVATVRFLVENSRFSLLESLAHAIAEAVLDDARVDAVTVGVRKLRPPLAADVATVGVRIRRSRDERSRSSQ
jgi:7,8-dihydroneopterin aldolase/epimerase/oxygenase